MLYANKTFVACVWLLVDRTFIFGFLTERWVWHHPSAAHYWKWCSVHPSKGFHYDSGNFWRPGNIQLAFL